MSFKQSGSVVIDVDSGVSKLQDAFAMNITEQVASGTITGSKQIDMTTTFHSYTVNGNCSITFKPSTEAARSNTACGVTIRLYMSGTRTVVWPSNVKWSDATPPDVSVNGADWYSFVTYDNGSTYNGLT